MVVGGCGSAVVLVTMVSGSFDVVDTCDSVVGTSVLEVCEASVVSKSVIAVVNVNGV